MPDIIRLRSVFFTPLHATTRIPIAEIRTKPGYLQVQLLPVVRRVDTGEDPFAVAKACESIAAISMLDLPLPEACGPRLSWGELVRVRYPDGTYEDLDERQEVASSCENRLPEEPPWGAPATYRLMDLQPVGSGEDRCVSFCDGPRPISLVPVTSARGAVALIEPLDGGKLWDRIMVESWEQEARRLRGDMRYIAASQRGWAKNEQDLATQPPSAEKAVTHKAGKLGAANALWIAASQIERRLQPEARRRR